MTDNEKGRTLIDIPADGNYIEILGHRIDGFESFEAFLEHLKKYVVLEETVKVQKVEIKRLNGVIKNFIATKERQKAEIERLENECFCLANERDAYKDVLDDAVTEAVKEFAERLKEKAVDVGICDAQGNGYGGATVILIGDIDNLVKEMVGAESG